MCRAVAAEERAARLADALIRAEEQTARMELEMAGMEEQLDRAQRQVEVRGLKGVRRGGSNRRRGGWIGRGVI